MANKYGNYLNGIFYGHLVSINGVSRTVAKGTGNNYTGWLDIDIWIIRNLMNFKNCRLKSKFYSANKKSFEYLFGKENIKVKELPDKFIVLEINDAAREHAKPFIEEA